MVNPVRRLGHGLDGSAVNCPHKRNQKIYRNGFFPCSNLLFYPGQQDLLKNYHISNALVKWLAPGFQVRSYNYATEPVMDKESQWECKWPHYQVQCFKLNFLKNSTSQAKYCSMPSKMQKK